MNGSQSLDHGSDYEQSLHRVEIRCAGQGMVPIEIGSTGPCTRREERLKHMRRGDSHIREEINTRIHLQSFG